MAPLNALLIRQSREVGNSFTQAFSVLGFLH